MPPITDSATVRSDLVRALRLDLVGPGTGDEALAHEVLSQAPSRWYLTGFLVPLGAPEQQRAEVAADDELDTIDEAGGSDDAVTPEPGPARRAFLPSSMGLSVLVGTDVEVLDVVVRWGDYRRESGVQVAAVIRAVLEPLPPLRVLARLAMLSRLMPCLRSRAGRRQERCRNGRGPSDSRESARFHSQLRSRAQVALDIPRSDAPCRPIGTQDGHPGQ